MHSPDDFLYALENTKVVTPPERRLETFGNSVLNYYLVTEDMDRANESKVREGTIVAERPQIVSPATLSQLLLEGFGEQGSKFAQVVNQNAHKFAILKYGFRIKKSEVRCYEVHEAIERVVDRVNEEVKSKKDPLAAVLTGVEDAWEVCLLKFMLDMVTASGESNISDLRDKGLL
jgi:formate dehydrogenase maturation protein FdhE